MDNTTCPCGAPTNGQVTCPSCAPAYRAGMMRAAEIVADITDKLDDCFCSPSRVCKIISDDIRKEAGP